MNPGDEFRGLCVMCKKPTEGERYIFCLKCKRKCEICVHGGAPPPPNVIGMYEVKSVCCGADIQWAGSITCSKHCHEELVTEFEKKFGPEKIIMDAETGIEYRVPTRDMIEIGVRHVDLPKYPKVGD